MGIIKFIAIVAVILGFLTWSDFFQVETLPLGMENAVVLFTGTIQALIDLLPWLSIPWNYFLIALSIHFALLLWHWIRWMISHI